jgi:hypothetical protein
MEVSQDEKKNKGQLMARFCCVKTPFVRSVNLAAKE